MISGAAGRLWPCRRGHVDGEYAAGSGSGFVIGDVVIVRAQAQTRTLLGISHRMVPRNWASVHGMEKTRTRECGDTSRTVPLIVGASHTGLIIIARGANNGSLHAMCASAAKEKMAAHEQAPV
jgi:hypothetical protein